MLEKPEQNKAVDLAVKTWLGKALQCGTSTEKNAVLFLTIQISILKQDIDTNMVHLHLILLQLSLFISFSVPP